MNTGFSGYEMRRILCLGAPGFLRDERTGAGSGCLPDAACSFSSSHLGGGPAGGLGTAGAGGCAAACSAPKSASSRSRMDWSFSGSRPATCSCPLTFFMSMSLTCWNFFIRAFGSAYLDSSARSFASNSAAILSVTCAAAGLGGAAFALAWTFSDADSEEEDSLLLLSDSSSELSKPGPSASLPLSFAAGAPGAAAAPAAAAEAPGPAAPPWPDFFASSALAELGADAGVRDFFFRCAAGAASSSGCWKASPWSEASSTSASMARIAMVRLYV
mmetsp:Transcript_50486/g.161583  ORF Transcript_50486/g.161583 Transcript_50486/m.161583 type:complete len:273 (+) Transcript_50486:356-1174(+)